MDGKKSASGFIGYLRSIFYGIPASNKNTVEYILIFIGCMILGNALESMDSYYILDECYSATNMNAACLLYASCLLFGALRRTKPSVLNVLPLGHKRRVGFVYLGIAILTAIIALVLAVCVLVMLTFVILIGLAVGGVFIFESEFSPTPYIPVSFPGIFFAIFMVVLVFGAGSIISYMPNKKSRRVVTIAFPVFIKLFALMIVNFISGEDNLVRAGCVPVMFETLPYYGIWLTVIGVLSAAILVCSVFVTFCSEKPSEL